MSNLNPNSSPHHSRAPSRSPSISIPQQTAMDSSSSSSSTIPMVAGNEAALLTQMFQRIQELEARTNDANSRYQQLEIQNQQLVHQLQSAAGSSSIVAHSNLVNHASSRVHGKPGNLAKWNGTGNITHWCNAVSNYLIVTGTTHGEDQINLICSYLEADILTWWLSKRTDLTNNGTVSNWNWIEMKKVFEKHYHPLQRNTVNRTKLKSLKQTGSFQAYYHKFLEIVSGISDLGVADKLDYFRNGLHFKIQERLLMGSEEVVGDFEKLVNAISFMEAKRFDYYQQRNPSSGYSSHNTVSSSSSTSSGSSTSDAMDLSNLFTEGKSYDALWSDEVSQLNVAAAAATVATTTGGKTAEKLFTVAEVNSLINSKLKQFKTKAKGSANGSGGPNVKRLSPEEFKKRISAGVCFKCCQTGHVGKSCNNDWNMQNFQ